MSEELIKNHKVLCTLRLHADTALWLDKLATENNYRSWRQAAEVVIEQAMGKRPSSSSSVSELDEKVTKILAILEDAVK
jgi:hypothetical protein